MKRIYHHFEKWEDWRDGLYKATAQTEEQLVVRAARLLSNPKMLEMAMEMAVVKWIHSAEHNLTNRSRNRQAWLGQAACCLVCGTPEHLTKSAWHRLSLAEQTTANGIADKILTDWDVDYAKEKNRN